MSDWKSGIELYPGMRLMRLTAIEDSLSSRSIRLFGFRVGVSDDGGYSDVIS
jgi:hypothetical protein